MMKTKKMIWLVLMILIVLTFVPNVLGDVLASYTNASVYSDSTDQTYLGTQFGSSKAINFTVDQQSYVDTLTMWIGTGGPGIKGIIMTIHEDNGSGYPASTYITDAYVNVTLGVNDEWNATTGHLATNITLEADTQYFFVYRPSYYATGIYGYTGIDLNGDNALNDWFCQTLALGTWQSCPQDPLWAISPTGYSPYFEINGTPVGSPEGPYSGNITYPLDTNIYEINPNGVGVNALAVFYYNGSIINDSYFANVTFDNITLLGSGVQYELTSGANWTYDGSYWNITSANFTLPVNTGMYNLSMTMTFNTTYVYNMTSNLSVNITNSAPVLENFTFADTTGDTGLYFGETLDYLRINWTDEDSDLTVYVSVWDPDNVLKVDRSNTTVIGTGIKGYETNLFLSAVGSWIVKFNATDTNGLTTWYNSTINVSKINVSSSGRIYGYDYENLSDYQNINSSIFTYGYYVIEIRINRTDNWTQISNLLEEMKNNSQVAILTLEDDLTNNVETMNFISANYSELIDGDHLNAIRQLKIYVPDGVTNSTANTDILNNFTKRMFQNVSNKFPIYIRNYMSADINTNYATEDSAPYIYGNNQSDLLKAEAGFLRNTTSKTRIYYNLTADLKSNSYDWQNNIIDKMRSTVKGSASYASTAIGELTNNDFIIVNPNATADYYIIDLNDTINQTDIYDLTSKTIVELYNDGIVNITIPAETGLMIYSTNLTKIIVGDDDSFTLYGSDTGYTKSTTVFSNSTDALLFDATGGNPVDGRIMLTDPSYVFPEFYVWYGTAGAEAISNWSRFNTTILADYSAVNWIGTIANETDMYGYISVNDYGNDNYPVGCTPGVDCTDWNRTYWIQIKELSVDNWTNIQDNVNVFVDGLDIGAVNDIDGLFGDALITLTDYVKISKQRKAILNTYTSYEAYANLGDMTMRESACGRWDGSQANPTYSYESIALDVARADFHKIHNIPVLAQTFGNITDYEKAYYCYMQNKVLYGDLMMYSYNQPLFEYTSAPESFQWNYYKYPDLGASLEDDYNVTYGDTYVRRFEKGIVSVNATARTVSYDTDLAVTNLEYCGWFYDNSDTAGNEGYMHYVINDNLSKSFNITDDDLTAFVKTWKCATIDQSLYEPSGFYEIEYYYLDADGDATGNTGIYVYYGNQSESDRLSFYETTNDDHPVNDESDYNYYATEINYAINFTVNASSTGSALDDISTELTRTQSGTEKVDVVISGSKNWNLSVYDKLTFINKSKFTGIFVGDTELNYQNDSTCLTSVAMYDLTNVTTPVPGTITTFLNANDSAFDNNTGNSSFVMLDYPNAVDDDYSTYAYPDILYPYCITTGVIYYYENFTIPANMNYTNITTQVYSGDAGNGVTNYLQYYNGSEWLSCADATGKSGIHNLTCSDVDITGWTDLQIRVGLYASEYGATDPYGNTCKITVHSQSSTYAVVRFYDSEVSFFGDETIDEEWGACYYDSDPSSTGYYTKVLIPGITPEKSYEVRANSFPVIENTTINLSSLDGLQYWNISFDSYDPDADSLSLCSITVNGTVYSLSPVSGNCNLLIAENFTTQGLVAIPSVLDSYNDSSTNGENLTLGYLVYDEIAASTNTSNLTRQFFWKYYNFTQNYGSFSNINFIYNNSDEVNRSINLTNGTSRNYIDYFTNLVTSTDYYFLPDANNFYVVDQAETIYRYFNVSGSLATGEDVPPVNISLPTSNYTSGAEYMNSTCDTFNTNYTNFTTGSSKSAFTETVTDGSQNCYVYYYPATIIFSDSTINYTFAGNLTNYSFQNSQGDAYGRRIISMFQDLTNTSINLTDNLTYASLPNWTNKTTLATNAFLYVSPDNFTERTNATDYFLTDDSTNEVFSIYWNNTRVPFDNLYFNLTWTSNTTATIYYECNDGVDNDGDGLIDYPADDGCTSATDDSEYTAPAGGGGTGTTTEDTTVPEEDLTLGEILDLSNKTPEQLNQMRVAVAIFAGVWILFRVFDKPKKKNINWRNEYG